MKKISLCVAVFLVFAGALQAATITQTKTFSGQPNYSSTLTFNQFDDHGGAWTLQSIYINVVLNTASGAYLGIDNDGQTSASGTVSFGSNGSITGSSVTLLTPSLSTFYASLVSTSSKQMSLSADDGDPAGQFDIGGTDYARWTPGDLTSTIGGYVDSSVFADYIGTGTFDTTINSDISAAISTWTGVEADPDNALPVGNFSARITYEFIPEPTAVGLLGLGGVITLAVSRVRRK